MSNFLYEPLPHHTPPLHLPPAFMADICQTVPCSIWSCFRVALKMRAKEFGFRIRFLDVSCMEISTVRVKTFAPFSVLGFFFVSVIYFSRIIEVEEITNKDAHEPSATPIAASLASASHRYQTSDCFSCLPLWGFPVFSAFRHFELIRASTGKYYHDFSICLKKKLALLIFSQA